MILAQDTYGFRKEVAIFTSSLERFGLHNRVKDNFLASFKRMILIEFIINSHPEISHKKFLKSIVYDVLSAMVSILQDRERYFQLNVRSMVEHIARIALQKVDSGGDFDITVRLQDFLALKSQHQNENWNYLHQQYTQACSWLHSSSNIALNINSTFDDLLVSDKRTNKKSMSDLLNSITKEILKTIFNYYNQPIKNAFVRSRSEFRYLIGPACFRYFEATFTVQD
ncbi:hypothetical protein [Pantoea ananatis]|uniref:hypothetical protein n=1 Tax=Pantoea ananas TaxID=553 RepID=UPI001B316B2E|nr:hypothetical protein [Pantoea ananatis]